MFGTGRPLMVRVVLRRLRLVGERNADRHRGIIYSSQRPAEWVARARVAPHHGQCVYLGRTPSLAESTKAWRQPL